MSNGFCTCAFEQYGGAWGSENICQETDSRSSSGIGVMTLSVEENKGRGHGRYSFWSVMREHVFKVGRRKRFRSNRRPVLTSPKL